MALTIPITVDLGTLQANLSAVTGGVSRLEQDVTRSMQRMAQQTGQSASATATSLANIEQATKATARATQVMAQQMTSAHDKARDGVNQLSRANAGLGISLRSLASSFGVVLSAQALLGFAKELVEAGIAQQSFMLSLKAATGSSLAAGEAYTFVRTQANALGLDLQTAVKGFASLTAATQGTAIQGQQTRDLFVALSQASRVLGLSTTDLQGVITALTQIVGKGVVSMEELRQQLGERLPSVLRLTAEEMGVTVASMVKMVETGNLLAVDFIPAITRALQTMGQEAPTAAGNAQAALARLGNAFFELKVSIANSGVLEAVAAIAERIASALNQLGLLVRGAQQAQGTERIGQLQQRLVVLSKQLETADLAAQNRQAMGLNAQAALSAADNVRRQVQATADAITKIDQQLKGATAAEEQLAAAAKQRSAAEAADKSLAGASNAPAKIREEIAKLDQQLAIVRSKNVEALQKYGLDPLLQDFEQVKAATEKRLLADRDKLNDQLLGIDRKAGIKAVGIAGNVAAERAREEVAALESGLARQLSATKIGFDQQRQLLDQELSDRLDREPAAHEAIAQEVGRRRREIAVEEAKALERIEITALNNLKTARLAVLDAEIAGAKGNQVQIATFQRQKVEVEQDTAAKILISQTKRAEVEQGLSKKTLDVRLAAAEAEQKAVEAANAAVLQSRIALSNAEQALIQAQVEGEVITKQEGAERLRVSQEQEFAMQRTRLQTQAAAEIAAAGDNAAQVKAIEQRLTHDLKMLGTQQLTTQQQLLNKQTEAWRQFGEDVQQTTSDLIFDFLKNGFAQIGKTFENLLDYMLRLLADFAAMLARPIVMHIIASVVGGIAGALGPAIQGLFGGGGGLSGLAGVGGAGGSGGLMNLLGLAGVANQGLGGTSGLMNLFGPTSSVGIALSGFTNMLDQGAAAIGGSIADLFGLTTLPASGLGALGGLAGIGGGLYTAFTAKGLGGQIGGGIGAAGGAAALIGSLGLGTLAIPGLQPIGLALAALAPLIGTLIDSLGAPKGPRFVLGDLGGLGVGLSGGDLTLTGALTAGNTRAERLPGGADAGAIQTALEAGVERAIQAMVTTINQVASDPSALLGPAQEALNTAMRDALIVNSASKDNFQKDIEAQLKAVAVQLAVNFLGPLSDAVRQLEQQDVATQIQRLPEVVGLAAQQFQGLSRAVDDLVATGQTDVSNIIPQLRDQLSTFRQRLIDTAVTVSGQIVDAVIATSTEALDEILGQSAIVQSLTLPSLFQQPLQALSSLKGAQAQLEAVGINDTQGIQDQITRLVGSILEDATLILADAFSGPADTFAQALMVALSIPPAVMALNPLLQEIQILAQTFAPVEDRLMQSMASLTAVLTPLDTKVADTATLMTELRDAIADAGDNIAVALPLYDQLRQAILRSAELQIQALEEARRAHIDLVQEQLDGLEAQRQAHQDVADALRSQLDSLEALAERAVAARRGAQAPAATLAELQGEIATLEAALPTLSGQEQVDALEQLVTLNEELLQLGGEYNLLDVQREALENLSELEAAIKLAHDTGVAQLTTEQAILTSLETQITSGEAQLALLQDDQVIQEQIKAIQQAALDQLAQLNAQLQQLFLSQTAVQEALHLPIPVVVQSAPAQTGGFMTLASGGVVPAMLEPGESVWMPQNQAQAHALSTWNSAFPRLGFGGLVPGFGSGDTVPAFLPQGSFVMNRRGTSALQGRGYQGGGPVQGGQVVSRHDTAEVHLHGPFYVNGYPDVRRLAKDVKDELDRLYGRQNRNTYNR